MRGRTRISLLACLFALGLAGCGSDNGTIPENQSSDLLGLLDSVRSNADSGDCDHAAETAQEFSNRVEELPSEVDADVREELDKAAANLDQLASEADQCQQADIGTSDEGGVQPPETTETVEPTTTSTDEESTTTTTTTTEEETQPDEPSGNQGGDQGQTEQPPTPPSTPPPTPPSGDQGQQGGSGGGEPPSGGVGAGGGAG